MNLRHAIAMTATTLALLVAGTGCGSGSSAPATRSATPVATPSIPAATLAGYLHDLRDPADGGGGDDQRLAAGHTPDSVLVAAGEVACAALHSGVADPFAPVQRQGWDQTDAMDIALAAGHSQLCKALGLGPASPAGVVETSLQG